jgi:DNA-binding winged helix-turn-helix (wHTH) protein
VEFRILGPVDVWSGGRPLALQGEAQRALLAVLLLHANRPVSADRLIDELWGERAGAGAVKRLQVAISRLRRALGLSAERAGDGVLATLPGGYVLRVGPEQLDSERFERLVAEGRRALEAQEPDVATVTLRAALELWRGPALSDVAFASFAQGHIARLEELRLVALEDRIGRWTPTAGPVRGSSKSSASSPAPCSATCTTPCCARTPTYRPCQAMAGPRRPARRMPLAAPKRPGAERHGRSPRPRPRCSDARRTSSG